MFTVHVVVNRAMSDQYVRDLRWRADAIEAITEAAEAHLTTFFEDCNLCALHARRRTLMMGDLGLAKRLRD